MATEPKIYSKNYVSSDNSYTVSSGSTSWSNAYDRDVSSQWISSGANSDLTDVTIDMIFYEGSTAIDRTITFMLLTNTNIKALDVYYYDGLNYVLWSTITNQSSSTIVVTLTSQTTARARLVIHSTQTANQEKAIGEITLANLLLDIGQDFYTYDVNFRQKVKDMITGDGSLQRGVIRWSYNRIEKYECSWSLILATDSLLNSLNAIKTLGEPFLWYPESVSRPSEIWYVHWYDPRKYKYQTYVKSAGNTISANFREV